MIKRKRMHSLLEWVIAGLGLWALFWIWAWYQCATGG